MRIDRRAQFDLRAWRDLLPDRFIPISLVSSTLIRRAGFVRFHSRAAYRLPGGYSNLEPLLPIPNRTVKRVCADDSVHSHAKVGHRQTIPRSPIPRGVGLFCLQILTISPPDFISWKACGGTATMKLSLSPERASPALRALINHVILPATKKISGHL